MRGQITRDGKQVWPTWNYVSPGTIEEVQAQLLESLRNIAAAQLAQTEALAQESKDVLAARQKIDRRLAAKFPAPAGRPRRA